MVSLSAVLAVAERFSLLFFVVLVVLAVVNDFCF
jgi:hypothetical protein